MRSSCLKRIFVIFLLIIRCLCDLQLHTAVSAPQATPSAPALIWVYLSEDPGASVPLIVNLQQHFVGEVPPLSSDPGHVVRVQSETWLGPSTPVATVKVSNTADGKFSGAARNAIVTIAIDPTHCPSPCPPARTTLVHIPEVDPPVVLADVALVVVDQGPAIVHLIWGAEALPVVPVSYVVAPPPGFAATTNEGRGQDAIVTFSQDLHAATVVIARTGAHIPSSPAPLRLVPVSETGLPARLELNVVAAENIFSPQDRATYPLGTPHCEPVTSVRTTRPVRPPRHPGPRITIRPSRQTVLYVPSDLQLPPGVALVAPGPATFTLRGTHACAESALSVKHAGRPTAWRSGCSISVDLDPGAMYTIIAHKADGGAVATAVATGLAVQAEGVQVQLTDGGSVAWVNVHKEPTLCTTPLYPRAPAPAAPAPATAAAAAAAAAAAGVEPVYTLSQGSSTQRGLQEGLTVRTCQPVTLRTCILGICATTTSAPAAAACPPPPPLHPLANFIAVSILLGALFVAVLACGFVYVRARFALTTCALRASMLGSALSAPGAGVGVGAAGTLVTITRPKLRYKTPEEATANAIFTRLVAVEALAPAHPGRPSRVLYSAVTGHTDPEDPGTEGEEKEKEKQDVKEMKTQSARKQWKLDISDVQKLIDDLQPSGVGGGVRASPARRLSSLPPCTRRALQRAGVVAAVALPAVALGGAVGLGASIPLSLFRPLAARTAHAVVAAAAAATAVGAAAGTYSLLSHGVAYPSVAAGGAITGFCALTLAVMWHRTLDWSVISGAVVAVPAAVLGAFFVV